MKVQTSFLNTAQGRAGYVNNLVTQLLAENPGMSKREARRQAVAYLADACNMVKAQRRQMRRLEQEQALFEGTSPEVLGTPVRQRTALSSRARAASARACAGTESGNRDTVRKPRTESGPAIIVRRKAG